MPRLRSACTLCLVAVVGCSDPTGADPELARTPTAWAELEALSRQASEAGQSKRGRDLYMAAEAVRLSGRSSVVTVTTGGEARAYRAVVLEWGLDLIASSAEPTLEKTLIAWRGAAAEGLLSAAVVTDTVFGTPAGEDSVEFIGNLPPGPWAQVEATGEHWTATDGTVVAVRRALLGACATPPRGSGSNGPLQCSRAAYDVRLDISGSATAPPTLTLTATGVAGARLVAPCDAGDCYISLARR